MITTEQSEPSELLVRQRCLEGPTHCSPLYRALEQRGDNLALKQNEDDQRGRQDQDRAGTQERDIGGIVALERAERAGHCAFGRVFDQHQRQQKLIPRPDRHENAERRDWCARQRQVDAPEEIPQRCAIDARCF